MTTEGTMKRSIYDAAFATSQPQAKKFNINDDVHSQLLKMIILGGRGDYQQQHQELGGNNTIRHHQLPVAAAASPYCLPPYAFTADVSSKAASSTSAAGPQPPQRFAWTPSSHPNHDVPTQASIISASSDNSTATVGGFNDDFILEQSMKLIFPTLHQDALASSPLVPAAPSNSLEMLSAVSSEVADVTSINKPPPSSAAASAATVAFPTLEVGSLPSRLPNPASSPSSPTSSLSNPAIVVINDGDPSYKGERHPTTNQRHGFGIMSYPNGSVYTGNFENDKRHGFGKCWYPEGLGVYTGYWANGKRNGLGKMVYSNGEVYHGEWLSDLPYPPSAER
jgi:hypothetical protein